MIKSKKTSLTQGNETKSGEDTDRSAGLFNKMMLESKDEKKKMGIYRYNLNMMLQEYNRITKMNPYKIILQEFSNFPWYFTQKDGKPWTIESLEKELTKLEQGFYDEYK